MALSTDELLQQERRRLDAFSKEARAMVDSLNNDIRGRVSDTLQEILSKDVKNFRTLLETLVGELVREAFSDALGKAQTGGRLSASQLQGSADLIKLLERARRNL